MGRKNKACPRCRKAKKKCELLENGCSRCKRLALPCNLAGLPSIDPVPPKSCPDLPIEHVLPSILSVPNIACPGVPNIDCPVLPNVSFSHTGVDPTTRIIDQKNKPPIEHLRWSTVPRTSNAGGTDEFILRNGVSHVAVSNTPSSMRERAAYAKSAVSLHLSSKRARKNKNARAARKFWKQQKSLLTVPLPPKSDLIYIKQDLCKRVVFVDGGSTLNPPINPKLHVKCF